ICAMCNQPLPKDQIVEARGKFNTLKALELKSINSDGRELKIQNEEHQAQIKETTHTMNNQKQMVIGLEMELKDLEKESEVVDAEIPEHIVKLAEEIVDIEKRIEAGPNSDTTELEIDRREEQKKLAALDAAEKTRERIEELKQEEKDLSTKIEDLENQLSLMNRFIVTKAHALEDEINAQFEFVHWKLFNVLVNGDPEECCIPMVDGSTELSNSEENNVGLDSIRVLSEHYNFWAPVWCDNAEGITKPIEIPSQTFRLIVDPKHQELFVEIEK
ncbi:hypothetical protein LCGC14_2592620, partial [marine sediment metagenome]